MAFKIVGSSGVVIDTAGFAFPKHTATAFAVGDVVTNSVTNNGLIRATSTHDNNGATPLFGIAINAPVAATTEAIVVQLVDGMILEADLANNSSTAHNMQRMTLTDHDTLNNAGTDSAADTAIFTQIRPIGDASDKKALVVVKGVAGQVTA